MNGLEARARNAGEADGRHDGVNGWVMNPRPPLDLTTRSLAALAAYQRGYTTGHACGRDTREALLHHRDLERDLGCRGEIER